MNVKTQRNFTNYFLTISFILLIVVFIISIVAISKLVLSEVTPIQEHVLKTQSLLNDIEDVRKAAQINTNLTISSPFLEDTPYFEYNYEGYMVTSISQLNVNETKSIVTFFFNRPVGENNGTHYIIISNLNNLILGDTIVYLSEEGTKTGKFISFKNQKLLVEKIKTSEVIQIPKEWFLGKVFYMQEND